MKYRFFEFEDKEWLPDFIRKGMLDYLRFVLNTGNFYEPAAELIVQLLKHTGAAAVVDLCAGGGGATEQIQKTIQDKFQLEVPFILTDIFPNITAYQFIEQKSAGKITYCPLPVNATQVPVSLKGARTIFSAFHHFDEHTAIQVIQNAADAKEGIAIFDGGDKNIFFILVTTLLHPIAFILFTPFIRPFSWRRLLFTYLVPVIPFCTIWDGIVSITRLYAPGQLLKIANSITDTGYKWQAGKEKNKFGMHISYLVGYPGK